MDCPFIITVAPILDESMSTVRFHLEWLAKNNITRFRWDWKGLSERRGVTYQKTESIGRGGFQEMFSERQHLRFRFESEYDKLLFALRWA